MPEKHELQVVPGMRFQDTALNIARSKADAFLEWVTAVETEAIDQKLRSRSSKSMKNNNESPFAAILPGNQTWVKNMKKI